VHLQIFIILHEIFWYSIIIHYLAAHVDAAGVNLDNPEEIKGVRNFRLTTPHGITLGLWYA
jgi:hypothetical protein